MRFFNQMRNFLYNAEPALAREDKELLREARNLSYATNQLEREHAALVAVAQQAAIIEKSLELCYKTGSLLEHHEATRHYGNLASALTALAAVRAGNGGVK